MSLTHVENVAKHLNFSSTTKVWAARPKDISPWIYFSPFIGVGLFAIGYWIWTQGVNSYIGTGS